MNNSSTAKCPKCGAALTGAVLSGLCPDCLALVAFGSEPGKDNTIVVTGADAASTAQPALAATLRYFGDYELQEEIARGGMGVVYRARQVSLNRTVAVKMILSGQFAGTAQRQRFQREAEAAAQLRHPNIVAIHEVGEHQGRSYFSMDFIEGRTLAAVLREGKLPPARAGTLVKTLAEAVHYAHQRGTLHRDLKPSNILISADSQPHILDFGLARPIEGEAGLTCTGDVMGTPSYMPPEQAAGRGGEVGPASDVYALGAVLYEAITGRAPFTGGTMAEVLRQVIEADPAPPRRWNPNVPADLETICLKCLEKRPERRYHSARALEEELERFLNFEPILARPAGRLRKTWSWSQQNPWVLAAGCGLVVLLLACVAYGFWEKSRFLAWRLETGKEALPPQMEPPWRPWGLTMVTPTGKEAHLPKGGSPALLFLNLFPGVFFLLYFAGKTYRKAYRRRAESGTPLSGWRLLVHGGLGAIGAAFGIVYLLLQIRSWVWLTSPTHIFMLELTSTVCALALNWIAFRMVWEAVGMHETSRFRSTVDKTLERQLADEARRWSVFKLVGFALWLLFAAWCLACMGFLFFHLVLNARGLNLVIGVIGMLLSIAVAALLAWVVRKRLRLFTFVFAPLALALFAFALGVAALHPRLIAGLFGCSLLSAILTLSGLFFFRGRDTSPTGERLRFPGNPWLDALRGVALFIALFVLFHVVENWRGRREWVRVKAELAAKGESLDSASFLKPPVPDAENVMAHPYMKQYFIYGTKAMPISNPPYEIENVPYSLAALQKLPRRPEPITTVAGQKFEPNAAPSLQGILDWYAGYGRDFAQLEEALQRPQSQLSGDPRKLPEIPRPNFVSFRLAAQVYANLCKVHLVAGDADAALKDLRIMRRLMDAVLAKDPPFLLEAMVRVAISELYAQTLEETLAAGLWAKSHLEPVQRLGTGMDVLSSVARSLREERAGVLQYVRGLAAEGGWQDLSSDQGNTNRAWHIERTLQRLILPQGWIDQNCANFARMHQFQLEGLDLAKGLVDARAIEAGRIRFSEDLREGAPRPYYYLAAIAIPDAARAYQTTAKNQTLMDQAYLACALERCRAAKGEYPHTLDALVPAFAARLPHDLFDGQPLRYHRTDDGRYLLYSIGWNSKDDQGQMPLNKNGKPEWQDDKGDWVWQGVPHPR